MPMPPAVHCHCPCPYFKNTKLENMQKANPQNQNKTPQNRRRRRATHDDADGGHTSSMVGPRRRAVGNKSSNIKSLRSSLPPNMADMAALIASEIDRKAEKHGDKKFVTLYKKGMDVFYRGPNGLFVSAKILDVHFDDMLEPYYTIRKEDGAEKQTDNDHLSRNPTVTVITTSETKPQEKNIPITELSADQRRESEVSQLSYDPPNDCNAPENKLSAHHPGESAFTELDDGIRVSGLTKDEQKQKKNRRRSGMCPTCGEVRTHKPGLWKQMLPETVEGLVYKGECLKCNSLNTVMMKLGEPIVDNVRGSIHEQQPPQSDQLTGIAAQVKMADPQAKQTKYNNRGRSSNFVNHARAVFHRRASNDNPHDRPHKSSLASSLAIRRLGSDGQRTKEAMMRTPQRDQILDPPEGPHAPIHAKKTNARRTRRRPEGGHLSSSMPPMKSLSEAMQSMSAVSGTDLNKEEGLSLEPEGKDGANLYPILESGELPSNLMSTQGTTFGERLRRKLEPEMAPIHAKKTNARRTRRRPEGRHLSASMPPKKSISEAVQSVNAVSGTDFKKEQGLSLESEGKDGAKLKEEYQVLESRELPPNLMSTQGTTFEERLRHKFESGEGKVAEEGLVVVEDVPGEHHFASDRALVPANDGPSKNAEARVVRSQTRDTDPNSFFSGNCMSSFESNEDDNLSVGSLQKVDDFRCSDSNGDFGFYTGYVATLHMGTNGKEQLPQGRGEMVYDTGCITKGVWSNGSLKMKVAPPRERYQPYLLHKYSIGDIGHDEDMAKATVAAATKLHIGDCAFIRRSNGIWSYAIVKSRSDGTDASITFQVNPKGSSKTVTIEQWVGHVKLPAKPDILPGYSVGDSGREEDMIITSQRETMISVSKLRIDDAAWVRRSDGSWTYAIAIGRTDDGYDAQITFKINSRGCTKSIQISQCGKNICRIKHKEYRGLPEEDAKIIPQVIRRAKSPPRPTRRATRDSTDEKQSQRKHQDQGNQKQNPAKASSFMLEGPQEIQQIYKELDQRQKKGLTGSDTSQSQSHHSNEICDRSQKDTHQNQETRALAIFDNRHHDDIAAAAAAADDEIIFTEDGGSSLGGGYASLTDSMRAEGKMLMSLIRARRRRRATIGNATDDGEDSIDCSLDNLILDPYKKFRNWKEDADGGYTSLTDASKKSLRRAEKKDQLLTLLTRVAATDDDSRATRQLCDADASLDLSYDESLSSLRESFLNWRERKKQKERDQTREKPSRPKRHEEVEKKEKKDKKKSSTKDKKKKKRKEKEQSKEKPSTAIR